MSSSFFSRAGLRDLNIVDCFCLQRIYNQGGRKVVVFGIGPIYKTPLFRFIISKMTAAKAAAFTKLVDGAIKALNTQLLNLVTSMPADNVTFPMLTMVYIDTYGAVNDMIEDSARYGTSWLISLVSHHFCLHTVLSTEGPLDSSTCVSISRMAEDVPLLREVHETVLLVSVEIISVGNWVSIPGAFL